MAVNIHGQAREERIQSFAFVIGVLVCVGLCGCLAISSCLRQADEFKIELDGKINPNEAPLPSLVRLPGIGVGRAGAIVAHRERSGREGGEMRAFQNCTDLNKVRGVGPRTVENISEWLKFE
jgi:competence ComEA-like helix-hairpin-helix protein